MSAHDEDIKIQFVNGDYNFDGFFVDNKIKLKI